MAQWIRFFSSDTGAFIREWRASDEGHSADNVRMAADISKHFVLPTDECGNFVEIAEIDGYPGIRWTVVYPDGSWNIRKMRKKSKKKPTPKHKQDERAGYGFIFGAGSKLKGCGRVEGHQTNIRGELTAVYKALKTAIEGGVTHLLIITDLKHCTTVFGGPHPSISDWAATGYIAPHTKNQLKYQDLYKPIHEELQKVQACFLWERGHIGTPGNVQADALAKEGRDMQLPSDVNREDPRWKDANVVYAVGTCDYDEYGSDQREYAAYGIASKTSQTPYEVYVERLYEKPHQFRADMKAANKALQLCIQLNWKDLHLLVNSMGVMYACLYGHEWKANNWKSRKNKDLVNKDLLQEIVMKMDKLNARGVPVRFDLISVFGVEPPAELIKALPRCPDWRCAPTVRIAGYGPRGEYGTYWEDADMQKVAGFSAVWQNSELTRYGRVSGRQTRNRAVLLGVLAAIEQALEQREEEVILSIKCRYMYEQLAWNMGKWKRNGYRYDDDRHVCNQELMQVIEELKKKIWVQIKFDDEPLTAASLANVLAYKGSLTNLPVESEDDFWKYAVVANATGSVRRYKDSELQVAVSTMYWSKASRCYRHYCFPVQGEHTLQRVQLEAVRKALDSAIAKGLDRVIVRTNLNADTAIKDWEAFKATCDELNSDVMRMIDRRKRLIAVRFEAMGN